MGYGYAYLCVTFRMRRVAETFEQLGWDPYRAHGKGILWRGFFHAWKARVKHASRPFWLVLYCIEFTLLTLANTWCNIDVSLQLHSQFSSRANKSDSSAALQIMKMFFFSYEEKSRCPNWIPRLFNGISDPLAASQRNYLSNGWWIWNLLRPVEAETSPTRYVLISVNRQVSGPDGHLSSPCVWYAKWKSFKVAKPTCPESRLMKCWEFT